MADENESISSLLDEARRVILRRIATNDAMLSPKVLELAAAYAWLSSPEQAH